MKQMVCYGAARKKNMEYKNILLIKMSSLGDILHTLPFAAALRKRYPQAKITWLVHPQFAGFVPDPPVIDEVIYFDKVKFKKLGWSEKLQYFCEMRSLLHSKHFDLVIDMQGLFKSAVLAAISGCDNRIGYCEMREGSGLVSKAIGGSHSKDHVLSVIWTWRVILARRWIRWMMWSSRCRI